MPWIDYLVIGHICSDLTPDGSITGGTVSYAGRTARAFGYQTAVLTSAAPDYNLQQALPGIYIHNVPAAETTTFENVYTPGGRRQTIHSRAEPLCAEHLPPDWLNAPVVHLAPVADEIDPEMILRFDKSLVGLTPQGWMRGWDEKGRIYARDWPVASRYFPLAAAVILSEEDLPDRAMLDHYRQWSRLLVLTEGSRGCTVFYKNKIRRIPTKPVKEVDPTGAGDSFAAAFLNRLHQNGGDPWNAARFANKAAGATVAAAGLDAKILRIQQVFDDKTVN